MSSKNIVVSPSGKLYGSENVLLDFIEGSANEYFIYAPMQSILLKKLKGEGECVLPFSNLKALYLKIFLILLFNKKSFYLNEAGHISYVKVLARLLPFRRFVVSVRLLEDCNAKLHSLPENITLIPVSNYLKDNIKTTTNLTVIYDSYRLNSIGEESPEKQKKPLVIGIVGRISFTKGLDNIIVILDQLSSSELTRVQFNFYGTFDEEDDWYFIFKNKLDAFKDLNYKLCGFEKQSNIYANCHLILHLNKVEALGRIIFEAIDYNVPFLCYNIGGSGELANVLNLSILTCNDTSEMIKKIKLFIALGIIENYDYNHARQKIVDQFSPQKYAQQIENYLV